jgi:predicted acylesterase/phospholipase RssA
MAPVITEHRLAIVMNGGVSLAVWMGGVALELDNLRRASSGLSGPAASDSTDAKESAKATAEVALFALWKKHAAAKQTRFTVDVIAGTSAGGLNGVLLGTAIANGARLAGLRTLWMTAAQLSATALLRPQGDDPASVLDGGFFLEQITGAVQSLRDHATDEATDVALTVTATALRGQARMVRDGTGAWFSEPDHRRRFEFARVQDQFRYDAGDGFATTVRNDFDAVDAVARAARASASYPAAFAPVPELQALRDRRTWPSWSTGPQLEWLADGGILDNAPFDPVLKAIAKQPVESTWRRTLCYVVPSADEALPATDPAQASAGLPPPWTTVITSAFGMPRETDLRDDIEALHDQIRAGRSSFDVDRFSSLIAPGGGVLFATALSLATKGFPLYRQARGAAALYEVGDAVAAANDHAFLDPVTQVAPEEYAGDHPWLPAGLPTELPTQWTWGLAATERLVAVLVRSLAQRADVPDTVRATLSQLGQQVRAVRDAVLADCIERASTVPVPGQPAVSIATITDQAFTSLQVPATLAGLVCDAVNEFATGVPGDELSPLQVLQAALCVEVVNGAGGVPIDTRPRPIVDFIRMGISQPPQFAVEAMAYADLSVSQQTGFPPSASNILYGSRLGHFAAFGRPGWREWDWMWGRLNAAVHLGALLDLSAEEINEIADLILAAEGWTRKALIDEIPFVVAATTDNLMKAMNEDGLLLPATDAMFGLLGSQVATDPKAPGLARWVAVLCAREHPPGLSLAERAVRDLAKPARAMMWRLLEHEAG